MIDARTTDWGVGPVQLDIKMARLHGWSEAAIERAIDELRRISLREARVSHCMGPVPGCPCITCDRKAPDESMIDGGALRAAWRAAGVWP